MKKVFAVDANCLIAAISPWNEHHAHALATLQGRLARGEQMSISVQALTESYSVLTRVPVPFNLLPAAAWEALEIYVQSGTVFSMDSDSHLALLRRLAKAGVAGGRTYDAIIGECARQAGATVLLTFNARHFDPPPEGVAIVVPSA